VHAGPVGMDEVYRAGAARFMEVVRGLDDDSLRRAVPACPGWSVHDLLAHLAGSSTDHVEGRTEGAATSPWTARQVAARRSPEGALLEEWARNVEAVASLCDSPAPNPAWDVAVHLDDLREALGHPPGPRDEGWGDVLTAALAFWGRRSGATASVAEDGPDPGTTTWHVATAYGLWRALFSRRDRADLAGIVLRGDVDGFRRAAFFAD
jgi:uncharacterized protein (TIGR03083 family)